MDSLTVEEYHVLHAVGVLIEARRIGDVVRISDGAGPMDMGVAVEDADCAVVAIRAILKELGVENITKLNVFQPGDWR